MHDPRSDERVTAATYRPGSRESHARHTESSSTLPTPRRMSWRSPAGTGRRRRETLAVTTDWIFDLALGGAPVRAPFVAALLDRLAAAGIHPIDEGGGHVDVTSADGLDQHRVRTPHLAGWLADHGGATFAQDEAVTVGVTLSVPRPAQPAAAISLGVTGSSFWRPAERDGAWAKVHRLLRDVVGMPAVRRIRGFDDDMAEHALDQLLAERHDDDPAHWGLLGWLNLAPPATDDARALVRAAEVIGIAPEVDDTAVELRLSPVPWGDTVDRFLAANRRWPTAR